MGLWAKGMGWRAPGWVLGVLVVPRPLASGMVVPRLLPFLVEDAAAGQASLVALEPRLGLADEARVGHRGAIRVGDIGRDAHVDPKR